MIVNKKEIYGLNIPQDVKDTVSNLFRTGQLWKKKRKDWAEKMRLRVRFHTALIILLLRKVIQDQGGMERASIEVCNDFDGHFHEMKDMIYKNISKLAPLLQQEDILQVKFQKPSLIDDVGRKLREKDPEARAYNLLRIDMDELIDLIKK